MPESLYCEHGSTRSLEKPPWIANAAAKCSCIAASLGESAFHKELNRALAAREKLSAHERSRLTPFAPRSILWYYELLLYGLLFHTPSATQPLSGSAQQHSHWLEFGVRAGGSLNATCAALLSMHANGRNVTAHGFDTFTGLPEPWEQMGAGTFSQDGRLPPVHSCARLHQGLINETLPSFLARHRHTLTSNALEGASIDVDLYRGTTDALGLIEPFLRPRTLLHFHELARPFTEADGATLRYWRARFGPAGWTGNHTRNVHHPDVRAKLLRAHKYRRMRSSAPSIGSFAVAIQAFVSGSCPSSAVSTSPLCS